MNQRKDTVEITREQRDVLREDIIGFIMAVATDTRAVGAAAAIAIGGTVGLDALLPRLTDRKESATPRKQPPHRHGHRAWLGSRRSARPSRRCNRGREAARARRTAFPARSRRESVEPPADGAPRKRPKVSAPGGYRFHPGWSGPVRLSAGRIGASASRACARGSKVVSRRRRPPGSRPTLRGGRSRAHARAAESASLRRSGPWVRVGQSGRERPLGGRRTRPVRVARSDAPARRPRGPVGKAR